MSSVNGCERQTALDASPHANAGATNRCTISRSVAVSPTGQYSSDITTRTTHCAACGSRSVNPVSSVAKPASSGDPVSHTTSLARIELNMSWPDGSDRINLSATVIAVTTRSGPRRFSTV